jgi:membrane-associated protease RseP (regulator of RpoE activity)
MIHEAGHFFAAKISKMRVEEFAFGFPPKLFGKKVGETLYAFNALPIGGYVKITGEGGVTLVEHMRPDIILLDIHMPEMNGDEALAKIRSAPWGKDIPVIVLTNLGEEESPKNIRSLGIDGYIVKADYTPKQVVARVIDTLK